jgi:threonine synthase
VGEIVGGRILTPAGESRRVPVAEPFAATDEPVELEYACAPELLPAPGGPLDLWRYAGLLPLQPGAIRYPLAVGGTPLLGSERLRRWLGTSRLWLKDESRGPSSSNKDRATALVLEHALRTGVETVTCASTGNVAVSLAVGAAAAGVRAVIFVPSTVYESKLRIMLFAGATVLKVREGYGAAFDLSRRAARAFGWLDRNTGVNPATVEAKKTVALEVWEQLGRSVPDAVVAPVGDGPTLSALAKGFAELRACGASNRVPRLIGVQASGSAPLVAAWETGRTPAAVEPSTIADGIAVGAPIGGALALRDVRQSRGAFLAVSDEAILAAMRELASRAGVLAEPAGAAAFAGLRVALDRGVVGPAEETVVLVTGSALKTPQFIGRQDEAAEVAEVRGSLAEVEELLGGGGPARR